MRIAITYVIKVFVESHANFNAVQHTRLQFSYVITQVMACVIGTRNCERLYSTSITADTVWYQLHGRDVSGRSNCFVYYSFEVMCNH